MGEKLTREQVNRLQKAIAEVRAVVVSAASLSADEECRLFFDGTCVILLHDVVGVEHAWRYEHFIRDPERDRRDLITRAEAMFAEAGEAGDGLRVIEWLGEAGAVEPPEVVRVVERELLGQRLFTIQGGQFDGSGLFWSGIGGGKTLLSNVGDEHEAAIDDLIDSSGHHDTPEAQCAALGWEFVPLAKPTTPETVILRPTGETDVYSLHGGGYSGETVEWHCGDDISTNAHLNRRTPGLGDGLWGPGKFAEFYDSTFQVDEANHPTLTAYLAAIPGDWRLEGE